MNQPIGVECAGLLQQGTSVSQTGGDIHARRRVFLDDKVIIAGVCFTFRWCVTSGCSSSPSSEPTPQLPTRGTARCRDVGHPCGARSVVEARCGFACIAHRRQWRRDDNIGETRRTTLGLRCVTLEATHGTGSPCRRTHLAQEGQSPNASRWPQRHSHHLPPCRGMLCQEISCNAGRHRQRPWSENKSDAHPPYARSKGAMNPTPRTGSRQALRTSAPLDFASGSGGVEDIHVLNLC